MWSKRTATWKKSSTAAADSLENQPTFFNSDWEIFGQKIKFICSSIKKKLEKGKYSKHFHIVNEEQHERVNPTLVRNRDTNSLFHL